MSRSLFLLQKIIFASTSQIYEIFCQIQIFFLTCYTVKLYKCQFYFLMSRISMDFPSSGPKVWLTRSANFDTISRNLRFPVAS